LVFESLKKKISESERYNNSKLWQTRSPKLLVAFIIVFLVALGFLSAGATIIVVSSSSDIIDYFEQASDVLDAPAVFLNPTDYILEQHLFEIPASYKGKTIPVTINFNMSSDSFFTQNTLFEINTTASIRYSDLKSNAIDVLYITIKQLNATDVYPYEYSPQGYQYSNFQHQKGETSLYPRYNYLSGQETNETFKATSYFTFQNNGSLVCNVTFAFNRYYYSNSSLREEIESENEPFQSEVTFTYRFSNLFVKSYLDLTAEEKTELRTMSDQRQQNFQVRLQTIQTAMLLQNEEIQKYTSQQNLGFTFVIISLALIEIAFAIYVDSKDDERKEKYRYKKRQREYEKQEQDYIF
jgi:hypothetical protein